MKFTDEKPTVPGAYWVRHESLDRPALIEVHEFEGELWCNLHQPTTFSRGDEGYGYTVRQLDPDFEWCGPLARLSEEDPPVVHLPTAPSALPCGDVLATERANAAHNTLREVKKALDAAGVKWVEGRKAPGMSPLFAAPYGKDS